MRRTEGNASVFAAGPAPHPPLRNTQVFHLTRNLRIVWKRIEQEIDDEMMVMMLRIIIIIIIMSSSISSLLHAHVNFECCDKFKLSNLLHPSVPLHKELYAGWWYRGTSLTRPPSPLGPYISPMPRDLW